MFCIKEWKQKLLQCAYKEQGKAQITQPEFSNYTMPSNNVCIFCLGTLTAITNLNIPPHARKLTANMAQINFKLDCMRNAGTQC